MESVYDETCLRSIKCLYQNRMPLGKRMTIWAAERGFLRCLKYIHTKEPRCTWDVYVTYAAAKSGNLDCLEYCHEAKCPFDQKATNVAAIHPKFDCLKYMLDRGYTCNYLATLDTAVRYGSIACFEFLLRYVALTKINEVSLLTAAAVEGQLNMVIHLHSKDFHWSENVTYTAILSAAYAKNVAINQPINLIQSIMHCLRYLRDKGCPFKEDNCQILFDECDLQNCIKCPETLRVNERPTVRSKCVPFAELISFPQKRYICDNIYKIGNEKN